MKQFVLENHWPRIPVEESGQLSAMMRDGSLPARRRFELLRLAQRQGQLFVAELSAQFGVSADTIRRDLDLLSVRFLQFVFVIVLPSLWGVSLTP